MADFNLIAPFYDKVKYFVFGAELERASTSFLQEIPANSKILIIGGGSGALLSEFDASQFISYVEASHKMIKLAKSRNFAANVKFICADVHSYPLNEEFDVIITPFILDCFNDTQLERLVSKLSGHLKQGGLWLHTDFYPQNFRQKAFVRFMYRCFRLSTGLKVKRLPDFDRLFNAHNFFQEKKAVFSNAMVHSFIYRKIA